MSEAPVDPEGEALVARFQGRVLEPIKRAFVGKDVIIDLLGVALIARENLFLLGPPGTAKSALVHELGRRIEGQTFEYLLTRFTEPNEVFGPFDIGRLREGELVTNTRGMLPEAHLIFLDELLNANSAILNSLLMVLNERVFRRGNERWELPTLMVVGASNHLPEDEALQALFDRFLLRVHCGNVAEDRLSEVLEAGWRREATEQSGGGGLSVADIQSLQRSVHRVGFSAVRGAYAELVGRLRAAGIAISDRRAVKLQKLLAASAVLCGRDEARVSDLWVLRHIWDAEEQRQVIAAIVDEVVARDPEATGAHPRAAARDRVDPEALARDLDAIEARLNSADLGPAARAALRDRLAILAGRCEWIDDELQRGYLRERVQDLWPQLEATAREPSP